MTDQKGMATIFSEVLTQLHDLDINQHDQSTLQELLLASEAKLNFICDGLKDIPGNVELESKKMCETKVLVEWQKKFLSQKLDELEQQNRGSAEKYATTLAAQDEEYEQKVAQIEKIESDCEHLQIRLTKKQATVAGHHRLMDAEISQQAKQRHILNVLATKYESKTAKSKFLEKQEALQAESVQLDELFNQKQMEIENLQVENAAKLKALKAVKIENGTKSDELIALRTKIDETREMSKRNDKNNLNVLSDFEAAEKQRKADIEQMERKIAEEQAKYENAKQLKTELINRINSEFGNDKSFDEMTAVAGAELEALDVDHTKLESSVNVISKLMERNEAKLAELNEAKEDILERLDRTMNLPDESSVNQDHQYRLQLSERGVSVGTEQPDIKNTVFLLPRALSKAKRRYAQMPLQQDRQQVPENGADPVVRSADSSITEFEASGLDSVMEGQIGPRDDHNRMKMFRENYL